MKRMLSINHLLFNSERKPEYVQNWLSKLLREVTLSEEDRFNIFQYNTGEWKTFDPSDYPEALEPVLREFDFTNSGPVFRYSDDPSIPPTFIVKAVYAETIAGTRFLDRTNLWIEFDMATEQYRLLDRTRSGRTIEPLGQSDLKAFRRITEAVVRRIMTPA